MKEGGHMNQEKVLVIEDDKNICHIIDLYLKKQNYSVECCHDGLEAYRKFKSNRYDVIVLDLMLPGLDGYSLCNKVREDSSTPIIMLTAKGTLEEKVKGLNLGADDYLTKPFDMHELIARIEAILRRRKMDYQEVKIKHSNRLTYDNLVFDVDSFIIYLNEQIIDVPRREAQLLQYLMQHPNQVLKRNELIENIWGWDFEGEDRVIDLYVKRLRKRLKTAQKQNWSIKTVWGIGYKFEVNRIV